jgi:hypothetical protein
MNLDSENADGSHGGAIVEPQHVTSDPKPHTFDLETSSEIEQYKTAVNDNAGEWTKSYDGLMAVTLN